MFVVVSYFRNCQSDCDMLNYIPCWQGHRLPHIQQQLLLLCLHREPTVRIAILSWLCAAVRVGTSTARGREKSSEKSLRSHLELSFQVAAANLAEVSLKHNFTLQCLSVAVEQRQREHRGDHCSRRNRHCPERERTHLA